MAAATPSATRQRGKWRDNGFISWIANNEALLGFLFILPSLIGFIAFFAVPAIRSVVISFHEWNLLSDAKFVGLDNYNDIFSDDRFWNSLRITVYYVLWNIPLETALAIFIAVMLERVQNSTFLRGFFILPWLMPSVVTALLFLWILDPSLGIMNVFLEGIGLESQPFLGSPDQVVPTLAFINIWRHAGYKSILVYAGLKTIPKSLYEAAEIDGAGRWMQFWRITLPLLRPVLVFVIVTGVIGSFQIFDTIAVTSQGGPAGASRTIIYYIYQEVFERRISMGTATAASVVLFLILVTVTLIQTRYLNAGRSDLADYQ